MKKYLCIFISTWLFCGILSAGGINAHFRSEFPDLCNERWARQTLGFSLILGFVSGPIGLLVTTGISGFFYDGWSLSVTECKK